MPFVVRLTLNVVAIPVAIASGMAGAQAVELAALHWPDGWLGSVMFGAIGALISFPIMLVVSLREMQRQHPTW